MLLLAVETSCDETSAAVVQDGRVRANVVSSQVRLHADYGGVVPELAAREHLRNWLPVTRAALEQAGVEPAQVEAVAATRGPGLPNALLVGFKAAQAFAYAWGRPFLGIHHHEAHLYSPWIRGQPPVAEFQGFEPNVALVVSGGHTFLACLPAEQEHHILGTTLDDAAGECFDKIAKLIGLSYPGGPELDQLAEEGDARHYGFPRPMLREANDDFSFAGLKTSVRYFLQRNPEVLEQRERVADVCCAVREAIVDVLVTKTIRAGRRLGVRCVTASGGVTCNRALRRELAAACEREGWTLRLAEPAFCTDNAAMIGVLAERKLQRGAPSLPWESEASPGLALETAGLTTPG